MDMYERKIYKNTSTLQIKKWHKHIKTCTLTTPHTEKENK